MSVDASGFTELYKTVYRDLYRFALCMMRHPQDAEDAVSEAVVSAYEHIHHLRKEEAFRSWIFTILVNVCRKKLKARERAETELLPHHMQSEPCDGLRVDVEKAFSLLSEEEQAIVGLSVFGGYSSREIGAMLCKNPATVRSRRSRALKKMSTVLESE